MRRTERPVAGALAYVGHQACDKRLWTIRISVDFVWTIRISVDFVLTEESIPKDFVSRAGRRTNLKTAGGWMRDRLPCLITRDPARFFPCGGSHQARLKHL